jgi:hypothetical protein
MKIKQQLRLDFLFLFTHRNVAENTYVNDGHVETYADKTLLLRLQ